MRLRPIILYTLLALTSTAAARPPLHEQSFKEILDGYYFVADFNVKEPEREVSSELFWRYPYSIPKIRFPIHTQIDNEDQELPLTPGEGLAMFHLNGGRSAFLSEDFDTAKSMWLAGRARFGNEFDHHRRNDYFIGLSFLQLARQAASQDDKGEQGDLPRALFANAATFLSSALILKEAITDPLFEDVSLKQYYNLAAIYFNYERYAGAYGAATHGLNFSRRTGRMEHRTPLSRILAESHIQNRDYLAAIQLFDEALRQSPSRDEASAIFTRVADIYFDLNNYELAENNYALANRISHESNQILPAQLVMRGEALFWLGRFSEAQQMLDFALRTMASHRAVAPLDSEYEAYARLRLADTYLARGEKEAARLAYYEVMQDYRRLEAGRIAKIRYACLELPQFEGNNLMHARNLLEDAKKSDVPPPAREVAWACHVASFAARDRSPSMVERVRKFYDRYPQSRFLAELVEPVRSVQSSRIYQYFSRNDHFGAVAFFEANRQTLFQGHHLKDDVKQKLFISYLSIGQVEKAAEFYQAFKQSDDTDLKSILEALFLSEMADKAEHSDWTNRNRTLGRALASRSWRIQRSPDTEQDLSRIQVSKGAQLHLPWIYNLNHHWASTDPDRYCAVLVPMMMRMHDAAEASSQHGLIDDMLRRNAAHLLPNILRSDEDCGIALLEFEIRWHQSNPAPLVQLYLERSGWPMSRHLVRLFWNVAELAWQGNMQPEARSLWRIIVERAPEGAREIAFAKSRLDTRRTEFERIWD